MDGYSVLIIPATIFIGFTYPSFGKSLLTLSAGLMKIILMFGGFVAAAEAAKRSKTRPVMAYSVVLIVWIAGVVGLMAERGNWPAGE